MIASALLLLLVKAALAVAFVGIGTAAAFLLLAYGFEKWRDWTGRPL